MFNSENFIDGIYNYCDRWCERCPFTARCRVYAMEKAREDQDLDLSDADNAAFWDGMVKEFESTASILENVANEFELDLEDEAFDPEDAFDADDVFSDDDDEDDSETEAMLEEHDGRCEENPLAQCAFDYASRVQRWQEERQDLLEAKVNEPMPAHLQAGQEQTGIHFGDALEVLGWYQYFIAAKLHRAVPGPDEDEHWLDPESEEVIQSDSNVEVQSQKDSEFPIRMFTYHYRIFDRYRQPVVSLAVLADENPDWRPSEFGYNLWGCSIQLMFPVVKLQDYRDDLLVLENHSNPFGLIVAAHLNSAATPTNGRPKKFGL